MAKVVLPVPFDPLPPVPPLLFCEAAGTFGALVLPWSPQAAAAIAMPAAIETSGIMRIARRARPTLSSLHIRIR
jgi:hypothetical protein